MVQAALGTAVAGVATGVNALKTQSHPLRHAPDLPQVSGILATLKDKKIAKQVRDEAKNERIMYMISQPEVLGLALTFVGILVAQNIRFAENDTSNEAAQAAATSAAILMGLGHAGCGDLTTAIVAGLGGVASLLSGVNIGDVVPSEQQLTNSVIRGGLSGIFPLYGLYNSIKGLS